MRKNGLQLTTDVDGKMMPPIIVFRYSRILREITDNVPIKLEKSEIHHQRISSMVIRIRNYITYNILPE